MDFKISAPVNPFSTVPAVPVDNTKQDLSDEIDKFDLVDLVDEVDLQDIEDIVLSEAPIGLHNSRVISTNVVPKGQGLKVRDAATQKLRELKDGQSYTKVLAPLCLIPALGYTLPIAATIALNNTETKKIKSLALRTTLAPYVETDIRNLLLLFTVEGKVPATFAKAQINYATLIERADANKTQLDEAIKKLRLYEKEGFKLAPTTKNQAEN